MDLQRMNTLAITVLLAGFALFMLFILSVLGIMQAGHPSGKSYFYPLLIVAAGIILFCIIFAIRTLKGEKSAVRGGGQNRIFVDYIHKDTPWKTAEKFLVVFLVLIILGIILSPADSLQRTVLYFCFFAILMWIFVQWALEYDPLPLPGKEEEYFTKAELDDPMTREIVLGLPRDVVYGYCLDTISTIWGPFAMAEKDPEKGTIDLMYGDFHLSFVLVQAGERNTRVHVSITPDLPQKWTPDKGRRQNIRYLDRIREELTGRVRQ
jgi:hypothetical protein